MKWAAPLGFVFLFISVAVAQDDPLKGRDPAQVKKYLEQMEKVLPLISQKKPEAPYKWGGFDRPRLIARAEILEKKIAGFRQAKGVTATPPVEDGAFVRRATLDLGGRIPTLAETTEFMNSKSPTKRQDLVFRLLASEDYVGHFFNYWASLLRVNTYMQGMPPRSYENWIKTVLRENVPYDEWVRRMVTARGAATEDNGAVGFMLRDRETGILDGMSETSQLFLGSQIGCAMCHNAKFEKWKQREFYALAAYFSEVQFFKDPVKALAIRDQLKTASAEEARKIQRQFRELPFIVFDKKGKELNLPDKYVYEPGDAGKPIHPAVLYGEAPEIEKGETWGKRREAFAQWLTAPGNPNFTKQIANRLWGQVYGRALVEPVNDLSDNSTSLSPELLAWAEELMKSLAYDMRSYLAVLALTPTYGLSPREGPFRADAFALDSHPLRRMRAEELKDSLVVVETGRAFTNIAALSAKMAEISSETLQSRIELSAFGKPGEQAAAQKKLMAEMSAGGMAAMAGGGMAGKITMGGYGVGILSCDQFQPVKAGSFLDQFGASRREAVDEGSVDANISQALTLMNGGETARLVRGGGKSGLYALLLENKNEALENLYLILYSRRPTAAETDEIKKYLGAQTPAAIADVVWALVNNREFYFVP